MHAQDVTARNVTQRGDFSQLPAKCHVAFMGGSITEMNGYRPMVCEMLKERFPETEFTFTAAGIASTCSTTGAFRLERDVLSQGPVDVFFVEFAVNDDLDAGHTREKAIRGMEGIVRHILRHNPAAKIVITYFVDEHKMEEYRAGRESVSIAAHEAVAAHYGIATVNVAREVQQQIDEKTLTWQQFGGVHPAPYGNRLAANMIATLLDAPVPDYAKNPAKNRELPESLEKFCYEHGRFLSPEHAAGTGWAWDVPDWKAIPGSFRQTFAGQKCLTAGQAGAEFTLEFTGSAIGVFVLAGPDAGVLEYTIDGGEPQRVNLHHHHSRGLHYPRTRMFADELAPGKHTLRVKLVEGAARILQFTVNAAE